MRLLALALIACSPSPQRAEITPIHAPPPPCPVTPSALAPLSDAEIVAVVDATGVARYSCTASGWAPAIPEAQLWSGRFVLGSHYGTVWMWGDGSSVVAPARASATVDTTAVPWQLSNVASHGGDGALASITQIQRLSTAGGLPTVTCSAATVGLEVDAPYAAQYWIYASSGTLGHPRCGG